MREIAVSIGDINGVGLEIALKSHEDISKFVHPIYFINRGLLERGVKILDIKIPKNFDIYELGKDFPIIPGKISKKSGEFSFLSFKKAISFVKNSSKSALVTLPINKNAWKKAKINFVGHTDVLGHEFKRKAIMMLGCDELFVALFTDHVALRDVSKMISWDCLYKFFLDLYYSSKFEKIGVLGFNPHASDGGVIGGKEEKQITKAIHLANLALKQEVFFGPLVPDAAFCSSGLEKFNRLVAMYHDGGLAPLKALYFDRAINTSLNLPIVRTSVDHGTALDIAYKGIANTKSFIEAVKWADKFAEIKFG